MTLCFISLTAQTHLLCRSEPNSFACVGWGAIDFFFFPPFTQWQHGEVLWGLGANELTLQCWGRRSITQGESEQAKMLRHMESQRGHYDRATQGLDGLNRISGRELPVSKVGHSTKRTSFFKMASAKCLSKLYFFPICPGLTAKELQLEGL